MHIKEKIPITVNLSQVDNTKSGYIHCAACRWDNSYDYSLRPTELRALSENASEKRLHQFLLGRTASNHCLKMLGITNPPPVTQGQNREPIWPQGVTGSLTHSGDWAISAIAYTNHVRAIGIDLEKVRQISVSHLLNMICTSQEFALFEETFPDCHTSNAYKKEATTRHAINLFSAKEAVYKAVFSLTKTKLRFKDVSFHWKADRIKLRDEQSNNEQLHSWQLQGTLLKDVQTGDATTELKIGQTLNIYCQTWDLRYVLTHVVL